MIVHNLNIEGITPLPAKTYTPLPINPDTVLPLPITMQLFQPIPRWYAQCVNIASCIEHIQFTQSNTFKILIAARMTCLV